MSHLDILLPFGLPPAEMAGDLLRALKTPALATLVARAKVNRHDTFDAFSRTLPHETWLTNQFGMEGHWHSGSSPPIASTAMQAFGLTVDSGVWFMLHPVHLHIARDHLVLTDPRQLALAEQESRALFDAAKPLFDELGKPLLYGDAQTWFIRADGWQDLRTATPDAACGHNIDIWMPQGDGERDWRKLQNEIQMLWHAHPINADRTARHLKPVNSIWLWGGSPATQQAVATRYQAVFNLPGWSKAFGPLAARQASGSTAPQVIAAAPEHGLVVCGDLIEAAFAGDWSSWLTRLHALEAEWFAPVLDALASGRIDRISLIMTHNTHLFEFTCSKQSLRKFWAAPSLARLIR